jgi:signal transduction histidine kinase
MPTLIALFAGVTAQLGLARAGRPRRFECRDWFPGALRALTTAGEPREIAALLTRHLQIGIDASCVEWWQRDEGGAYRSQQGGISGVPASVLDEWIVAAGTWRRHVPGSVTADATRVLSETGAELVVPLRVKECVIGFLAIGARRDRRPYDDQDVTCLEALAGHLALVADRVQIASRLDESRRMLHQATRLSTVGTLAVELAHEIRNPLVAVQTFLQILPERLDDPEVTGELRRVALTELQRVARLLNELLGMARASLITFAATDLEAVVEQVVRLLQVSAREKEVGIERTGDPLPPGTADASRLKQAIVNLLLNAIQASPAGKTVTVTTRTSLDAAGHTVVEVAINDEGPGIPEEDRETIFHPFFTTKENGTGLGLPVTRQIVVDHGGSITVEGAVGRGATFVIRLPLTVPSSERRDQTLEVRAA